MGRHSLIFCRIRLATIFQGFNFNFQKSNKFEGNTPQLIEELTATLSCLKSGCDPPLGIPRL